MQNKILTTIIALFIFCLIFLIGALLFISQDFEINYDVKQAKLEADYEYIVSNHPQYQIDWNELKQEIIEIIGKDEANYGVYIKDLETQQILEINSDLVVHPASIYKVPLAIIVLTDVDDGKISLDDKLLITDKEKIYQSDPMAQIDEDYTLDLRSILEYLIIYSDNTAMTTLEHRLGGVYDLQERMNAELEITNFTRLPGATTASETAEVFEGLYNETYLEPETNNFLLDLLKNVTESHNDRIKAGVPADIEVAHKIGTLSSTYHDAGIVYGKDRDYVIVVLNDHINPTEAQQKVKDISEITYEYLNLNEE